MVTQIPFLKQREREGERDPQSSYRHTHTHTHTSSSVTNNILNSIKIRKCHWHVIYMEHLISVVNSLRTHYSWGC